MNDSPVKKSYDSKRAMQWFLVLDGFVRVFIWHSSIAFTVALFTYLDAWPRHGLTGANLSNAWVWTQKLTHLVFLFNIFYLTHLVIFRMLIPTPKEGRYEIGPGKRVSRHLIYSVLIAALTKARYEAPFPGFLVFHLANLPPMSWLMGPIFGPRSGSCYATDPMIVDPHLVTIGRNVVIGLGALIGGHYQEAGSVVMSKSIIEDDVVIGVNAMLAGVHVHRGAMIGAGSVVLPGSVIGPNEYWSGNPARRRSTKPLPSETEMGVVEIPALLV